MTIFVVFRVSDPVQMEKALKDAFPDDHIKVHSGEWLISANGTVQEVSQKLGVNTADNKTTTGPAIVFSMSNYYGRATTDIWDWIKTKLEKTSG